MQVRVAIQDRSDRCYDRYKAPADDADGLTAVAVVAVIDTGVDVAGDVANEYFAGEDRFYRREASAACFCGC